MRTYFLMLALVLSVPIRGAQVQTSEPGQVPSIEHPTWDIDVKQFGYERFPHKQVRPVRIALDFSDNDHIAVGWIRPDVTVKQKTPKIGEPASLRVIVLDAKTGRKQIQKDWSTPYFSAPFLLGVPDGRFLICSDDSLRLLSGNLDTQLTQELPKHAPCRNVTLRPSPSRRTLLLSILAQQSRDLYLLNATTLDARFNWTEERVGAVYPRQTVAASDDWVVGICGESAEICLRRFDRQEWTPLRKAGVDTRVSKGHLPQASFIANDVLAIGSDTIAIVRAQGGVLFHITPPKGHYFLAPVASAEGERFVVKEEVLRGLRSEPLDMYPFQSDDQAIVYGLTNDRAVSSLKLKGTSPWSPWDVHENSVALSPDGASLAVISDGFLKVYQLPKSVLSNN